MRLSLFAAVFAFTCASNATAQTTGSISGTVTFANPQPFVSAGGQKRVGVYTATANVADSQLVRLVDVPCGNDSCNDYTISGLDPGTYYVRTVSDSFSLYADQWYPELFVAAPGARPRGVVVTAGATTAGINFGLTNVTGSISGTLTLATLPFRQPVHLPAVNVYNDDNVLVKTAQLAPTPGASSGSWLDTGTPAGGVFNWSVPGLPSGRYYVKTVNGASGGATFRPTETGGWWVDELFDRGPCVTVDCLPTLGTPITVTSGIGGTGSSNPSPIAIALDYGAVIGGVLPSTTFLGTSVVEIYDSRGVPLPVRTTSGCCGGYFANGLPAGTYFLKLRREPFGDFPETLYKDMACEGCAVTSGTPVTVSLGETKGGIDFVALPKRVIRGSVRTPGATLSQVKVELYAHNAALVATATTGSDGTFVFDGLNPGSYYLRTVNEFGYVDELYPNVACPGCDPLGGSAVTVSASADTTGIDFDLASGAAVSGLLKSVSTNPAASFPLTGASVSFFTPSNVLAGRAVTDRTGQFTVRLPQGTYYAISGPAFGHVRRLFLDGPCVSGICPFSGGDPIVAGGVFIEIGLPQCTAPAISPPTLANAAVGVPYRQSFGTTGSSLLPFAVSAGTLPPGLTLQAPLGVLAGTPTTAGRYTFTVDTDTCAATRTYTLDVPACVLNIGPTLSARATGESLSTFVATNCPSWSVSSNASWLSVEKVTTMIPHSVIVTASPNTSASPRRGTIVVGPRVVTVLQSGGAPQPPFGFLDTPANGTVVSGSVAVSGWALDDLAIRRVAIYRDPIAGEGSAQVYLGDATIVEGARPDVEATFPTAPGNRRAGYGYLLLTNMLPSAGNGVFVLHAYAEDTDGNRTLLGSRTVNAANAASTAPFGAIDTPAQGVTVFGNTYTNFGWALTPRSKLIPFDGSTIRVIIDGVDVGPVTSYNLFRADVSGLFPGLKNSGGPVGYRTIDTTALSEGLHTIAWVVTDDAGQATGIGSRYFNVQNSAWTPSLKLGLRMMPPAVSRSELASADASVTVPPRIDGIEIDRRSASLEGLPIDAEGRRTIELQGQRRLELQLAPDDSSCAARYEGYLSANGELRALPVGSSLDPAGIFYWQPGPAFRGSYQIEFVRTSCNGGRERVPVTVSIR